MVDGSGWRRLHSATDEGSTARHRPRADGGTLERRPVTTRMKERAMDEAPVGITISDPTLADNPLVYVNEVTKRDHYQPPQRYDREASSR